MPIYTVHTVSGLIVKRVDCPVDSYEHRPDDEHWIEGFSDDLLQYVLNGVITPRPTMAPTLSATIIQSNGIDSVTLGNLPTPCTVIYEGPGFRLEGEVAEGEATFTTDAPGAHKVTVSAWPYLDWTEEFDAL